MSAAPAYGGVLAYAPDDVIGVHPRYQKMFRADLRTCCVCAATEAPPPGRLLDEAGFLASYGADDTG